MSFTGALVIRLYMNLIDSISIHYINTSCKEYVKQITLVVCGLIMYLNISNLQFVLFSPMQSFFTPESCRLLRFMLSSFRLESDTRTGARAEQLLSVKSHSFNLQQENTNKQAEIEYTPYIC